MTLFVKKSSNGAGEETRSSQHVYTNLDLLSLSREDGGPCYIHTVDVSSEKSSSTLEIIGQIKVKISFV